MLKFNQGGQSLQLDPSQIWARWFWMCDMCYAAPLRYVPRTRTENENRGETEPLAPVMSLRKSYKTWARNDSSASISLNSRLRCFLFIEFDSSTPRLLPARA